MRFFFILCICLLVTSCIPLSFAPNIEANTIKIAKRFKRNLPKQYSYIFEDPKEANEFFDYINTKYQLPGIERKIPIWIDTKPYIMNFYERKKATRTVNIIPIMFDAALSSDDNDGLGLFNELYTSKRVKWYIIITITDLKGQDALSPKYAECKGVLMFLEAMQKEYLSTANYMEAYFRN